MREIDPLLGVRFGRAYEEYRVVVEVDDLHLPAIDCELGVMWKAERRKKKVEGRECKRQPWVAYTSPAMRKRLRTVHLELRRVFGALQGERMREGARRSTLELPDR